MNRIPETILVKVMTASGLRFTSAEADFVTACLTNNRVGWISDETVQNDTYSLVLAALAAILVQADNARIYSIHASPERMKKFRQFISGMLYNADVPGKAMSHLVSCSSFGELEAIDLNVMFYNVLLIDEPQKIELVNDRYNMVTYITTAPLESMQWFTAIYSVDRKASLLEYQDATLIYNEDLTKLIELILATREK